MKRGRLPFFRFATIFVLVLSGINLQAQQERVDSIRKALQSKPDDRLLSNKLFEALRVVSTDSALAETKKRLTRSEAKKDSVQIADVYHSFSVIYGEKNKFDQAETNARKSIDYAGKRNDSLRRSLVARAFMQLGAINTQQGMAREAIPFFDTTLSIRNAIGDSIGVCNVLISQGDVYKLVGDYPRSMQVLYKAIGIAQRYGSIMYEGRAYNNLANTYYSQGKYQEALDAYRKSIGLKLKLGNKKEIANSYSNMGGVFLTLTQYDSAQYYYNLALPMRIEARDLKGQGSTYYNIGITYTRQKQFAKAGENLQKALSIRRQINDRRGMCTSYNALSELSSELSDYALSLRYADSSEIIAHELSLEPMLVQVWTNKSSALAHLGRFEEAYELLDSAYTMHERMDSIQDSELSEQMRSIFNLQQKDREILDIQFKREQERIQSRNQFYLFLALAVLVLLVLLFIVMRYRSNQKAKAVLQNAYNQIEAKNKDITDSINYARHIQEAILPDAGLIKKLFPGSFILYKPKDIVSGDFYWAAAGSDGKLHVLAVADCTGHGVPGAFMSVVGTEQLYRVAKDSHIRTPAEALRAMDEGMRTLLKQTGDSTGAKDGMDIALCALDYDSKTLHFSGAFRPLYLVRDGELMEYEAARCSIGGAYDTEKNFIDHEIHLLPGDVFYLFTDGFADQFGGDQGKKFKQKKLRELFCTISSLPPEEQRKKLDEAFESWRGQHEQLDDICIIGVKI